MLQMHHCFMVEKLQDNPYLVTLIQNNLVLHGVGIVANKQEEIQMQEGDTAFIPAGEVHWHGAADGNDFFHISLTRPDSQTDMVK